jgi:apolipoprotein D and lipocalin family protein
MKTGLLRSYGPWVILVAAGAALAGCAAFAGGPRGNENVPAPARTVELDHYLGRWYELARYDNRFERGCEGVTAEYSRRDDGYIGVKNTCRVGSPDGTARESLGRAKVVLDSGGAKLKVSFWGPFFVGDYWVLDHADDYSWSIVGEPSGRFLWILTRAARPSDSLTETLYKRVAALGYDTSLLRRTAQPG